MTLNHEQAIEDYTHFMRLVNVGAYEERSSYHYERGTWPKDGVEESLFNLEELAARDGLEFFGTEQTGYRLAPMSDETREARAQAQAYQDEDEDEDMYEHEEEGDGSGLHQCPYCYNLVNEDHEEFCRLNPNRNREIVP